MLMSTYSLPTPTAVMWVGFSPPFVCMFFRMISQKQMQLGSPTRRRTVPQKHCRRGSLHACECWLLLVSTARRYASAVYVVVVCRLSVRSSVTNRRCTRMTKRRMTQITPDDSRHSNEVNPNGAPNRGGVGTNRRFLTNISLCLKNGES